LGSGAAGNRNAKDKQRRVAKVKQTAFSQEDAQLVPSVKRRKLLCYIVGHLVSNAKYLTLTPF
jgi:hypothetical protein